jgi:hypothetical protein
MAYAIVQSVQGHTTVAGTTIDSASITPSAGNCLVAIVFLYASTGDHTITLSDTTGSNGTWTNPSPAAVWNGSASFQEKIQIFYLPSAAATASVIRATSDDTSISSRLAIWVVEISGLDASPFLASAFGWNGSPGSGADVITTGFSGVLASQPACVIGLCTELSENETPAAGTGFTGLAAMWNANASRAEHKRVTSTASVAATFGATAGANATTAMIVLKESGGGGGTPLMGQACL